MNTYNVSVNIQSGGHFANVTITVDGFTMSLAADTARQMLVLSGVKGEMRITGIFLVD
jgi:hypothetical protein